MRIPLSLLVAVTAVFCLSSGVIVLTYEYELEDLETKYVDLQTDYGYAMEMIQIYKNNPELAKDIVDSIHAQELI